MILKKKKRNLKKNQINASTFIPQYIFVVVSGMRRSEEPFACLRSPRERNNSLISNSPLPSILVLLLIAERMKDS